MSTVKSRHYNRSKHQKDSPPVCKGHSFIFNIHFNPLLGEGTGGWGGLHPTSPSLGHTETSNHHTAVRPHCRSTRVNNGHHKSCSQITLPSSVYLFINLMNPDSDAIGIKSLQNLPSSPIQSWF